MFNCKSIPVVLTAAFVAILSSGEARGQSGKEYCPNYDGKTPPELVVAANGWMNYEDELSLESLRGHAVWLEFSFIACGGCQLMKPHLQGLQHRYGPDGLVVIDINNGKVDTRDALAEEVAHLQPNYPVLWDEEGRTCDAFGVHTYGTAYLIDAGGVVIWGGNPIELTVIDMWKLVDEALTDVDTSALREAGDRLLSRNPVGPAPVAHESVAAPTADEIAIRYDLGWHFSIRTADNSMLIERVRADSPAAVAGLAAGDTIVSIDGLVLSEVPFDRLKEALHRLEEVPDPVTLGVMRDDELIEITATPAPARNR